MHDVCRILLVDDHKLLMEGIRSLLAPHSHLRVAGMAPDGKEAVGLAATLSPDLVIMDISMPGMNGVEASRAIRQRLSPAEGGPDIGMLSPREKEIFRLLADGYSVRQIGDALNISPKTVETHKYSVLTKLRAGSINELTKMAIRLGLVSL